MTDKEKIKDTKEQTHTPTAMRQQIKEGTFKKSSQNEVEKKYYYRTIDGVLTEFERGIKDD